MTVNSLTLVGFLGRDPSIRTRQSGDKVAELSLATSERWRDRETRERRERTQWHRVVVYAPALAELCEKYLKKGSQIYVRGALETRNWKDREGRDRYVTEVVVPQRKGQLELLDRRPPSDEAPPAAHEEPPPAAEAPPLVDVDDLPI